MTENTQSSKAQHVWRTEFAVSMHCESCVEDVQKALRSELLEGDVDKVDVDLAEQSVIVEGKAPPSKISRILKDTGRQVIVRGTSSPNGNTDPSLPAAAAVAILEAPIPDTTVKTYDFQGGPSQHVRGLARMLQSDSDSEGRVVTLLDLTMKLPLLTTIPQPSRKSSQATATKPDNVSTSPLVCSVYVATTGDMTNPPVSTGAPFRKLGAVECDPTTGYGDLFIEVDGLSVWDIIGRGFVVQVEDGGAGLAERIWAGVVARSSGVWGNNKTVCSCSGMTMWEENRMMASL